VDLPLRLLFENPTLADLAGLIERVTGQQTSAGGDGRAGRRLPAIPKRPEPSETHPLSFAQERLWFLEQMEADGALAHVPVAMRLEGPLDTAALERAIQTLIRRHESLRTTFTERQGQLLARVSGEACVPFEQVDLSGQSADEQGESLGRLKEERTRRPMDLECGPLVRVTLVRLADREHVLLVVFHHIICDGWSLEVLLGELAEVYAAFANGEPAGLAELPIRLADYACWERGRLSGEALAAGLAYWKRRLEGAPTVLELPTDRPRPAALRYRGAAESRRLPERLGAAVEALAQGRKATPFMVFLAAWEALLSRYSGSEDLCIGTPMANRVRPELEGVVGCLINTVVLRGDLAGDPAFEELVDRVREAVLEDLAHGEVPFGKLVETLARGRPIDRLPLVQAMFLFQSPAAAPPSMGGLRLEEIEVDYTAMTTFDLTLVVEPRGEELNVVLAYNRELFDPATVRRMLDSYLAILERVAAEPAAQLSRLALPADEELEHLLVELNETDRLLPEAACIDELIETQVARSPDAVAIEFDDRKLTYGELDARANRLARYLRGLGVGRDSLVGIHLERSPEMVAAMLAVWKAGGAYVPLDPAYPSRRLALMIEDASPAVLLTETALRDGLPAADCQVVCLDGARAAIDREPADRLPGRSDGDCLAYVIYTSGSTGVPKGVMIHHRAVVNFLDAFAELLELGPKDVLAAVTTISFDIAVLELFLPLAVGARTVIADRATAVDGRRLAALIERHRVSVLQATPSTYRMLLMSGWHGGRGLRLVCGGEAMDAGLASSLADECDVLWNVYGPTETTIWSTIHRVQRDKAVVPIGRPIANTQVYVLDSRGRPVPQGVAGELWIGGLGVGRGYLNRPEMTAERFVANPFANSSNGRLYRTGDRVRWRGDGVLEFLGRLDQQVKIRGFRVELGEVEAALSCHTDVAQAAVVPRGDASGESRLVAYVVSSNGRALRPDELRRFLAARLPDYMVPTGFVEMKALPRTPAGKVDRRALPEADQSRFATTAEFVAPRTPLEMKIAGLWAEVLRVEQVGVEDNFFELGGHSLLATQLLSRLRDHLGIDLPLRTLFEEPTVAGLAAVVAGDGEAADVAARAPPIRRTSHEGDLPLSYAQERLWLLDQLAPNHPFYNMPVAVRINRPVDVEALRAAMNEIVRRHEALRTTFAVAGGGPVQRIAPRLELDLPVIDLSRFDESRQQSEVDRYTKQKRDRPFDLSRGPLVRACLLRLGEAEHVFLLVMHHIVSDGWSMGVLVGELTELYEASAAGRPARLPELPVQYADYALWQRKWLSGEVLDGQLSYWKETLSGLPELELPTDRPRPAVQTFRGASETFRFSRQTAEALEKLSRREGVTLFVTLLAAFQTLLHRYTGQDDIAVGSGIANRGRAELEGLIGFFVNAVVMRGDLSGDPTFRELLARVHQVCLGAYAHQDLPFDKLVEELQPERRSNYNPLSRVFLVLQNFPMPSVESSGVGFDELLTGAGTAKFDLTLFLRETEEGLLAALEYNTDLFERATVVRLLGHFERLVEGALADPDARLSELPLLTEPERRQVLIDFNATATDYPRDACIQELFEGQARQTPDAPAVVFEGQTLSYRQLNERSNQLAHHLRGLGVGPEVLVGICVERSIEMIVGLLGILKAGGAYVPLDPSYPRERLEFMLEDTGVRLLLAAGSLAEQLPTLAVETVRLDGDFDRFAKYGRDNPSVQTGPENLAYVMYTSGSTGRPKGVAVVHRSVVRLVRRTNYVELGPNEVFLLFAPLSFDASTFEIWGPLLTRGKLVVFPPGLPTPDELGRFIRDHRITTLWLTAGLFHQQVDTGLEYLSGVRQLLAGGDVLSPPHVAKALAKLKDCLLINGYGPTENTTFTCCHTMRSGEKVDGPIPIGSPVANTQVYILDRHRQPVPVGVPGELYIGGDGLARGYHGHPELTAEKFVPNPFSTSSDSRLYRTGDLARWLPDGAVEFLGRIDRQVKVRGFRIEPKEIESALVEHPAIREAAVTVRRDRPDDKRLVAYFVANTDDTEGGRQVRRWHREHIAEWLRLYDDTYSRPPADDDPTFNIVGWESSYTGEPIPADQMQVWVDQTVERIRARQPSRVLEIGCGTGLLLFRVAPDCTKYWGTDFSQPALKHVEKQLERPGRQLPQVRLLERTADDFEGVETDSFDMVILNSVVQYFPDIDYLVDVLHKAADAVRPGGSIFVGDVRSLPLLEALHASVEMHKAPASLSLGELRRRVEDRIEQEQELVIDPAFFFALQQAWPKVGHVEVRQKRGREDNELTKFRYDVLLGIDGTAAAPREVRWLDWRKERLTVADLGRLLDERRPDLLGLRDVPNARLRDEVRILRWLASEDPSKILGDLRGELSDGANDTVHPESLWALGEQKGYRVEIGTSDAPAEGTCDVLLRRCDGRTGEPASGVVEFPRRRAPEGRTWSRFANYPLKRKRARRLVPRLREHVRTKLPDYMMPSAFVPLETMPLTPNGKIDYAALPAPDSSRPELQKQYLAPRNPTEALLAEIWSEVLGIDRVGVADNFFDLGGHSMLAVQVMSEIERRCGRRLPLASLFQEPTIEHLGRLLAEPEASSTASSLVLLASGGGDRPFFCIHPGGGTVFCYRALAEHFGGERTFYGLQAVGVDGLNPPHEEAEQMAAYYIDTIRTVQPAGPYLLGGWSLGGNIAFETARQLAQQGEEVALLALFDAGAMPPTRQPKEDDFLPLMMDLFPDSEALSLEELRAMSPQEQLAYFVDRAAQAQIVMGTGDAEAGRHVFEVFKANLKVLHDYRPKPYPGKVTLFRAEHQDDAWGAAHDPQLGWGAWAQGGVEVHTIPGSHIHMVIEPNVRVLAEKLRRCLAVAGV